MKFLDFYKEKLDCDTEEQVFNYLIDTLQYSIFSWDFFVDWGKIKTNIQKVETELNILNSLIGKNDIENKLLEIVNDYPKTRSVLPMLLAIREEKIKKQPILIDKENLEVEKKDHLFKANRKYTKKDEKDLINFFINSGLKDIFFDKDVKNLVDYCYGVEVGLDTNGRKNRGGHAMEDLVEKEIKSLCNKNNYKYLKEANAQRIKGELGYDVPVDKSSRRYDFVIDTRDQLYIFEINFYAGGGSKLKSTAGEYRSLHDILKDKYNFIWITDGQGWKNTSKPLRETFEHNDYLFNLRILKEGILNYLFKLDS